MKNIGLYIHIPFCIKKCAYCSFNSITDISIMPEYFAALRHEIEEQAKICSKTIDTIYLGGGTPSFVDERYISEVLELVTKRFSTDFREVSIECNPDSIQEDKLLNYKKFGINRVSIGVQSLNDDCLKYIGRVHNSTTAKTAVSLARSIFDNVNIDYMLNLKHQDVKDIEDCVALVSEFDIPHISCYGLSIEEDTPLFFKGVEVDEDVTADLYDLCVSKLQRNNINRYEISNFAKDGFECLHNLKYWRMQEYIGVGVSAHSYIDGKRIQNTDSMQKYISKDFIDNQILISSKDKQFEYIMLNLRLACGIDLQEFHSLFACDFLSTYSDVIKRYGEHFSIEKGRICVNSKGMYVINSLLTNFL